jgi:hypothetical protein
MIAQFQVCHVEQQWRVIGGGGGVVWMRWWQWCSLVFDNVAGGPEGPKIQNQAIVAQFWAAGCREGCSGVVPPSSCNNLTCGGGE